MREYEPCFALLIRDFIAYRRASGRWDEVSYGPNLRVFDRPCAMNYPDSVYLTQEMVDGWYRQRDGKTSNSCRLRIYAVCSFIKYLSERGLPEVLPSGIPRKERATYIPYAFSGDEIRSFLGACDNLLDVPRTRNVFIRRITVSVLFRLLYSSGICTTEAGLLECTDVDVGNEIFNIRYSKGHDQHYITLYDNTADLMRRYDSATREWFSSRKYFFLAPGDTAYPYTWVEKNSRRVWAEVSNGRTATAYALRHHYAAANINCWIGDRLVFDDKLTCLSKSMGHTTSESTRYHYSVVPGLSDIVLKKTGDGFNELMPEMISR